jgi:Domain of unknown function (DUF4276)
MPKKLVLYVEGGGDSKQLLSMCREGFRAFFEKLGFETRLLKIVACGPRQSAYENFRLAHETSKPTDFIGLLVDSECGLLSENLWEHVRLRVGDGWEKPIWADDKQLLFMTQCMETWLCADLEALQDYYGQNFKPKSIPRRNNLEEVPKSVARNGKNQIEEKLKLATKDTTKGAFSKGNHSFDLLERVSPDKVLERCPRFKESVQELKEAVR